MGKARTLCLLRSIPHLPTEKKGSGADLIDKPRPLLSTPLWQGILYTNTQTFFTNTTRVKKKSVHEQLAQDIQVCVSAT